MLVKPNEEMSLTSIELFSGPNYAKLAALPKSTVNCTKSPGSSSTIRGSL
jgi:hypothetical protein